jgi:hypothetical protein
MNEMFGGGNKDLFTNNIRDEFQKVDAHRAIFGIRMGQKLDRQSK